jgi:NADPH:quinone reductase-like Zn-dependent oxidoreductase
VADVQPGQKVLVHAGAGGLGSTVIQVAKHLGAYVATTAHTNDVDKVRALGADEVIDFTQQDFTDLVSGYDVVLDSLGPASLEKSLTVLKPGGLGISVVGPPDPHFATQLGHPLLKPVMAVLSRKIRRQARRLGVRYVSFFMRADGSQLTTLRALYDAGTLRPVLDRSFPFDKTLDAMAYVEQGKAAGKVVVTR